MGADDNSNMAQSSYWCAGRRRSLFRRSGWIGALHVLRLQAFVAGDRLKGHGLPLVQGFIAGTQNGRVMHKYILPGFLGDKTKTLLVIEPLYFAAGHNSAPLICEAEPKAKKRTQLKISRVRKSLFPNAHSLNLNEK